MMPLRADLFWYVRGRVLSFEKTLLMAVLNITPDSFSDGAEFLDPEKALCRALQLVGEGADILDLGAESTRPGAVPVSEEEELARLLPVLEKIRARVSVPISIDTTKPGVARACLERGAEIINDVSGLKESGRGMAEVVKEFGAGLVLMHRRGNPATMQQMTGYADVTREVMEELAESLRIAESFGISEKQLVVDPGLGFAKTAEQNLEIVRSLEKFHALGRPLLLGPSRKAFLGKITGKETASERDWATAAVIALAVTKKVQIVRVHEAGSMKDVILTVEAVEGEENVRT